MPALDFPWAMTAKDTTRSPDARHLATVPGARHENLAHSDSEDRLREALEIIAKRQGTADAKTTLLAILEDAQDGPVEVNR